MIPRIKLSFVQSIFISIHELQCHVSYSGAYHCKSSFFNEVSPEEQRAAFGDCVLVTLDVIDKSCTSSDEILYWIVSFFQVLQETINKKRSKGAKRMYTCWNRQVLWVHYRQIRVLVNFLMSKSIWSCTQTSATTLLASSIQVKCPE